MIRPEALRIIPAAVAAGATTGQPAAPASSLPGAPADPPVADGDLVGEVLERRFAGPVTHYRVRAAGTELLVHGSAADAAVGDRVGVRATGIALAYTADRA
jgi:hypothetical protein